MERVRLCDYMVNFVHKLRNLPESYMMNSVLENFTVLQVTLDETDCLSTSSGWRGGATRKAFGLAISRSRIQILRNNLRQVVYTYVPLSPSSITWYRPKGGDALRLGR